MRALVTGGAGFVGSHVVDRLIDNGHEVAIIDDMSGGYHRNLNPAARVGVFDLADYERVDVMFAEVKPELVVHCAAYAAEGLSHWMRRYNYVNNLVSWANVANAAVTHGTRRVVVCSSMAVYGAQRPPFVESMTPQPIDPYGAAKAAMEVDVRALGQIHGTEWVIVRPHNVYGPRQNMADGYRNVAAIFMRQALTDTDVTVYGDGTQVRSLSYIDDVAAAISHIALGPRHGYVVNVGGEQPVPIRRLAEMVVEVSGSRSRIVHLPARHEVHTAFCDHDTLRSVVGVWRPIRLEDGLDRFAKWATDLEVAPLRSYDYEVTANLFAPWRPR